MSFLDDAEAAAKEAWHRVWAARLSLGSAAVCAIQVMLDLAQQQQPARAVILAGTCSFGSAVLHIIAPKQ